MKYINIFYDFKKLMFVIYFIIKYLKFYLIILIMIIKKISIFNNLIKLI